MKLNIPQVYLIDISNKNFGCQCPLTVFILTHPVNFPCGRKPHLGMVLDRLPYPVLCEINLSLSWSFSLDNERKVSHRPFQVELLVPPAKIKSELQFPH